MQMLPWPWPEPAKDERAAHLVPGCRIPDVTLPATSGERLSLARMAGRTVVVVYPWTGSPGEDNPPDWDMIPGAHGSTPQLLGFARLHHGFAEVGVRLVGMSAQPSSDQAVFAERHALPFPLLSDNHFELQRALRLPTFETGRIAYLTRITLVLRDGVIEQVFYPVHPPDTHGREVMYLCGATRPNANSGR
jgi:peroxiredoxin